MKMKINMFVKIRIDLHTKAQEDAEHGNDDRYEYGDEGESGDKG